MFSFSPAFLLNLLTCCPPRSFASFPFLLFLISLSCSVCFFLSPCSIFASCALGRLLQPTVIAPVFSLKGPFTLWQSGADPIVCSLIQPSWQLLRRNCLPPLNRGATPEKEKVHACIHSIDRSIAACFLAWSAPFVLEFWDRASSRTRASALDARRSRPRAAPQLNLVQPSPVASARVAYSQIEPVTRRKGQTSSSQPVCPCSLAFLHLSGPFPGRLLTDLSSCLQSMGEDGRLSEELCVDPEQ